MLSQKMNRKATPAFGKTGNLSCIWAATTALIQAVRSDEELTLSEVASRLSANLRDLRLAGIIDQTQSMIADLVIAIWLLDKKASALREAAQEIEAELDERIRRLDSESDVPEEVAERRELGEHAQGLSRVFFPLEIVSEAMQFALTLNKVHLRYSDRTSMDLMDDYEEPKLPDLLVHSALFADAAFKRLRAEHQIAMAEVEAYCEAKRTEGSSDYPDERTVMTAYYEALRQAFTAGCPSRVPTKRRTSSRA